MKEDPNDIEIVKQTLAIIMEFPSKAFLVCGCLFLLIGIAIVVVLR